MKKFLNFIRSTLGFELSVPFSDFAVSDFVFRDYKCSPIIHLFNVYNICNKYVIFIALLRIKLIYNNKFFFWR